VGLTAGSISASFVSNPLSGCGSGAIEFTTFYGHRWVTLTFDPVTF